MAVHVPAQCEGACLLKVWGGAEPISVLPVIECDASVHAPAAPELVLLSTVAYLRNEARYEALPDGALVSRGCGPLVVAKTEGTADSLKGQRIAIPGAESTEALLAETFLPGFTPVPCSDVMAALDNQEVFAAIIDTPLPEGFCPLVDLGERFRQYHANCLLPLRLWCVRRGLPDERREQLLDSLHEALARVRECPPESIEAAMPYVHDVNRETVGAFIRERFGKAVASGDDEISKGLEVLREYADADYYAANGRF